MGELDILRAQRQAEEEMVAWCLELAEEHRSEPDQLEPYYPYLKQAFERICTGSDERALSDKRLRRYLDVLVPLMNLSGDWAEVIAGLEGTVPAGDDASGEGAPENDRRLAWSFGWLAWFYELDARYEDSRTAARRSLRHAERTGGDALISQALNRLAKIHRTHGDYHRALEIYRRSIELARESGDVVALAWVLNSTGLTQWHLGELEAAQGSLSEALERASSADDQRRRAQVHNNLGLVLTALGAYEEARGVLEEALRLAESVADRREMGVVSGNLGEVLLYLGERKRARHSQKDAERLARELGSAYRTAKAKIRLSQLSRTADEPDALSRARELAAEAAEIGEAKKLHHFQILGRSYEAMAAAALGDGQRAAALSREAVEILARHQQFDGSRAEILFNHYLVLAESEPEEARQALLAADRHLNAQAELIRAVPLRQRFLEEIELHRTILAAVESLEEQPQSTRPASVRA